MSDPILLDSNSIVVRCVMASVAEEVEYDLPFTGGVLGSLNLLSNLLEERDIDAGRIVACFDHSPPPRRYRLIPGYKERRSDSDSVPWPFRSETQKMDAFAQIYRVKDALQTLGVTCLCYREREADDVLGALARIYIDRGERPIIVTSDHDMWQTVGWGARVWDLHSKEMVDASNFLEKASVSTDTYLLYKALLGDSSDKIAGVRGMGKKTIPALFERAHWHIRIVSEPREQLAALCEFLGRLPKRSKAERRVLLERRRISKVLQGIDLRTSFGPVDTLIARLDEEPPDVDWKAFCRVCKSSGLAAVLGAYTRYTRPFARAAKEFRDQGRRTKYA